MNIILIGFMGSGKSVVGKRLAQLLGWNYVDTDELIEKTEATSINEIFAKKGEKHFRDLETQVLNTLADYDRFVISAGGGMALRSENAEKLKQIGHLVLLSASPDILAERLKEVRDRPLLNVADRKRKIEEILRERNPIYQSVADYVIETSEISVDEVAREVIKCLKLE